MSAMGCGAVTSLTPETGPLVGGNPMLVTGLNFGVSVRRHIASSGPGLAASAWAHICNGMGSPLPTSEKD